MSTQSHVLRAGPPGPPPPPNFITPHIGPTDPTGIPAYGTQFQVLTSPAGVTPETFLTIAGVGDITGPNPQIAEVETTSHSTGSPVRTFIPSLADPGQVQFKLYWLPGDPTQDPTSPFSLEYLFWNRIVTKFRIVNTDANHRTREAYGFIKQISETYTVAGLCERTVIVRVSGAFVDVAPAVSMTPTSAAPLAAGGPATFSVKTGGSQTSWTPTPDVAWITITTPTGPTVGDATVNYTVALNSTGSPARSGHINIVALGLQFPVSQAAG
jgi:hypothetical protein